MKSAYQNFILSALNEDYEALMFEYTIIYIDS